MDDGALSELYPDVQSVASHHDCDGALSDAVLRAERSRSPVPSQRMPLCMQDHLPLRDD